MNGHNENGESIVAKGMDEWGPVLWEAPTAVFHLLPADSVGAAGASLCLGCLPGADP